MAGDLVDDALWEIVQPLIPPPAPHKSPAGRKRLDERRVLTGILFILQSGLPWEMLPQEMGCGSGMSCWLRARDWQQAGVWDKLHSILVAKLRNADRLDFSRVIADSSSVRAVHGGKNWAQLDLSAQGGQQAPSPRDGNGTPLNVILTGANRHDSTQLMPLLDGMPPIAGRRGHPLTRPKIVQADRAYDCERCYAVFCGSAAFARKLASAAPGMAATWA